MNLKELILRLHAQKLEADGIELVRKVELAELDESDLELMVFRKEDDTATTVDIVRGTTLWREGLERYPKFRGAIVRSGSLQRVIVKDSAIVDEGKERNLLEEGRIYTIPEELITSGKVFESLLPENAIMQFYFTEGRGPANVFGVTRITSLDQIVPGSRIMIDKDGGINSFEEIRVDEALTDEFRDEPARLITAGHHREAYATQDRGVRYMSTGWIVGSRRMALYPVPESLVKTGNVYRIR